MTNRSVIRAPITAVDRLVAVIEIGAEQIEVVTSLHTAHTFTALIVKETTY